MTRTIRPGVDIGHIRLKVSDLERAIDFYSGILGFEVTQRVGRHAALADASLCLLEAGRG